MGVFSENWVFFGGGLEGMGVFGVGGGGVVIGLANFEEHGAEGLVKKRLHWGMFR